MLAARLSEDPDVNVALKAGSSVNPVWIIDELPKGPTGTILRREISAPEGA